jgi:hypothetical protein
MGFDDTFKITVSDTQMYRQAGNSIVVDVLMAILREIDPTTIAVNRRISLPIQKDIPIKFYERTN